jgi:GNAT superfamily N-acetyltransferase
MPDRRGLSLTPVSLAEVQDLRARYRDEMRAQIVHDSWHARGFTDLYLARAGGLVVGYGAVGGAPREPRDTVKELYLLPEWRGEAMAVFDRLVSDAGARAVEVQTNDAQLLLPFFERATGIRLERLLFADAAATRLAPPDGVRLRPVAEDERDSVFPHAHEPVGEWGLDAGGVIVATGGVMFHYNPPYGDLYMEVAPGWRRRGYGSYLVQELKRICREQGGVPAARCQPDNAASRATLVRAGLFPCAHLLRGRLRRRGAAA